MGCCGRGTQIGTASRSTPLPAATSHAAPRPGQLVFEYVGGTALTALGAATGRRYRFDRPGARLAVEPADKASLMAVPQLRRVFGSA
jgi:hypothetical protein